MPESLARIHATLTSLAERERRNLRWTAAFAALAAWGLGWAALTALVGLDADRFGRILLAGWIAAGPLAALPFVRSAGDARRQAARLEALRPDLRGQLLTVLDRSARPLGSPSLVERLATRVGVAADSVPPAEVWPDRSVRRARRIALVAALLLAFTAAVEPGPVAALRALWSAGIRVEAQNDPALQGPRALVGDLTLRYLYPTYTRLEPLEVPNSNGDVHAPPGTRVEIRAKTAESTASAVLRAYAEELPVEVIGGRELRAALTVAGPGIWRFEFGDLPSPDYRIVPEPDLAPDVVARRPRGAGVAVDAPLALTWAARDDHGLGRVVLEIIQESGPRTVDLRALLDAPREASGLSQLTPLDLGLAPGDQAALRVGAWDNDEVSGSKVGWSATVRIGVVGANGKRVLQQRYWKELRDVLVDVLAAFVVEPSPPATQPPVLRSWVVLADARYDPIDVLVTEHWQGVESGTVDATLLRELAERRSALLSFARSLGERATIASADAGTLAELQDAHTVAVEQAILVLDEMVWRAAQARVGELVKQVADEATSLRADFEGLTAAEALARLDRLERVFGQLQRAAAALDEGGLKEFLNGRLDQMTTLMAEIRKAIAEGRTADAQKLVERLADAMERMKADLAAMQARQQQSEDELTNAMQGFERELDALQLGQTQLRERTEAARDGAGPKTASAAAVWGEVERLAATVAERSRGLEASAPDFRNANAGNRSALDDVRAEAEGLHDSARARDLATAIERAQRAEASAVYLQRRMKGARVPPESVAKAARELAGVRSDLARLQSLLAEIAQSRQAAEAQARDALSPMTAEQQALAEREARARGAAEQLARQLPMQAPGLEAGMRRAEREGGRAGGALESGDALGAEGAQRAAEEGLATAKRALEQAKKDLAQMREAGRQGSDGAERGEKSGDVEADQPLPMEIPAPEEFQTPEEYRRALLEGMTGQVPEEYKALNQRYYEELVRQ